MTKISIAYKTLKKITPFRSDYEVVSDGKNFGLKWSLVFFWVTIFSEFYDFEHGYWWSRSSEYFKNCWTKDMGLIEMVKRRYEA